MDRYFLRKLNLRSAVDQQPAIIVNELLFRCLTFETKVNPVQSNYNIGRIIKQLLNTERTGHFIEHGLSVGFELHVLFTVGQFVDKITAVRNSHFPCYC